MLRSTLLLCLLSVTLSANATSLPKDAGLAEVEALGQFNGVALACDFIETSNHIKTVIIQYAPKSRRYGAAFEEATHNAFLDQTKKDPTTCPDGPTLNEQVDIATRHLQTALHVSVKP